MKQYRNDGLWKSILAFAVVAILAILLGLLEGCAKIPVPVQIGPGTYEVPTIPKTDKAVIAGHDESDRLATVVVPPSDKPTTVRVYKKKVSVFKKVFTNTPKVRTVSDNPAVKAETPKTSLWKRWALLIGILAAVMLWAGKRLYNFSPWAFIWRLIKRIKT